MATNHKNDLLLVGAGFPRTGTACLRQVLTDDFGMKCYHWGTMMIEKDAPLWIKLSQTDPHDISGKQKLFDKIYRSNDPNKKYLACVDSPCFKFWREMLDYYPNCKILLSVRDPEKWHESVKETIVEYSNVCCQSFAYKSGILKLINPIFDAENRVEKLNFLTNFDFETDDDNNHNDDNNYNTESKVNIYAQCSKGVGLFGKIDDKEYVLKKWNKHIENVQKYCPKERLIIIDVSKDGYKKLIDNLKDVAPKVPWDKYNDPLPLVNTRQQFRKVIIAAKWKGYLYDSIIIVIVAIIVFIVYKWVGLNALLRNN